MFRMTFLLMFILLPVQSIAAINWSEGDVTWYGYSEGLEAMDAENKNGIIIVYSEKCGTCVEYAKMFKSQEIAKYSNDVVLIKIDRDRQRSLSENYQIDGNYVPRTYLLDSQGNVLESPYKSEKYMFYLPPRNEKYLSDLMRSLAGR